MTEKTSAADSTQTREQTVNPPLLRHLLSLQAYPPGKPIEEVQRETGLADVVKLASNENPLGPSPKAVAAMQAAAGEMNLYPDGGGFYLKRKLAAALTDALAARTASPSAGVAPEEIVLGNGSDEITLFLALCYLEAGRSIVTSQYAFVRYRMAAQLAGAETKLVPMPDFRHDAAALAAAVDETTQLIFIDNPCNPTGAMMNAEELKSLLEAVPPRVLVVVDEAYYEFASDDEAYPDTLALREEFPNLIVTRTFSKAYGLAGLRIGYGIARPEVVRDLDRVRPPFNTNRMAQAAALAALDDTAHLERSLANNKKGMSYLADEFDSLGLTVVPSWGNFYLVDFSSTGQSGAAIAEALMARGIIIRPMAGYGLTSHARISIGTAEENERLIAELGEVIETFAETEGPDAAEGSES